MAKARVRQRGRSEVRSSILALVLIWLVPAALLVVAVAMRPAAERADVIEPIPQYVPVGSQEVDQRQAVSVLIEWGPSDPVRSGASGTVTALFITEGDVVEEGQKLLAVDGVVRKAMRTEMPLYRPVKPGDAGADVEALSQHLVATGYLKKIRTTMDATMSAAVSEYERSIGLSATGTFQPEYVVYVSPSIGAIASVTVNVGDDIAGNTDIATGEPSPVRATLQPATDGASLRPLEGQPVTLTYGDASIPLTGTAPDGPDVDRVATLLGAEADTGGGETRVDGALLQLANPTTVGTVPATAVHITGDGVGCVFVKPGDARLTPVANLRGEVGIIGVDIALAGSDVVADVGTLTSAERDSCR